jgi:hypothetical protein
MAGSFIGVGSLRVSNGGIWGTFTVVSVVEITIKNKKAA